MQNITSTKELTLTIEPRQHPWQVDSLYAIHPDMRSHSGILMSLGKWGTYTASSKHKLNTKSSTEAELLPIDDAMTQILSTRNFLAAQDVYVPTTMSYQDNKGTILLA